ncbi:hypothetical protein F5144DRAFT_558113 [Chaetomium tenue]|uniref:Uncharacterized protein n=1 Tax=Chaetomium tenue TaxID=1854479 RepID=A0ACB7PRL2_9PEZI|nr:hypothetical protein F5144DRAFT_558113 [Chaetomium globosum]
MKSTPKPLVATFDRAGPPFSGLRSSHPEATHTSRQVHLPSPFSSHPPTLAPCHPHPTPPPPHLPHSPALPPPSTPPQPSQHTPPPPSPSLRQPHPPQQTHSPPYPSSLPPHPATRGRLSRPLQGRHRPGRARPQSRSRPSCRTDVTSVAAQSNHVHLPGRDVRICPISIERSRSLE